MTPQDMAMIKDIVVPLTSAVIGALLGGVPAFLLARRGSKEVLQRDKAARHDVELGLVRQVFVKLDIIANALGSHEQQVEEMIAKADQDGNDHMPIHQRISTFPGIDREPLVTFEACELAVFITAEAPDYVDELILLSRRYAAVLASLATFGRLRTELHYETSRQGITTRDASDVSTTAVHGSPGFQNYILLKADELELFARAMRRQLNDYAAFARAVAGRFGPVADGYLGKGLVPHLENKASTAGEA
ncbi:MAG: hypothetical protein JWR80_8911 [Bradyrhizobium sp.]|nr:hypothetical protein [Bradyrhizobium sp.]